MVRPRKITLAQAKLQGDLMVTFYCEAHRCHHQGEMRLDAAIARWGEHLRLDQIPARCSKCGSRDFVNVRARPPKRKGGHGIGPFIEE